MSFIDSIVKNFEKIKWSHHDGKMTSNLSHDKLDSLDHIPFRRPAKPKDKYELRRLIDSHVKPYEPDGDLNNIDLSEINDMSLLFLDSQFNGDISEWDVSNVENMRGIFERSRFKGDVSQRDILKVNTGREDIQERIDASLARISSESISPEEVMKTAEDEHSDLNMR